TNATVSGSFSGNGPQLTGLNASNLNLGTLAAARLVGTYNIAISDIADTATQASNADYATNADHATNAATATAAGSAGTAAALATTPSQCGTDKFSTGIA